MVTTEQGSTWDYPSARFPAPPSVRIGAPTTWVPVDAPGAIIAVAEPERTDGRFRSNVVVSVGRISPGTTLAELALALDAHVADLDDAHVITRGELDVAPGPALVAEVAFRHPGLGTLVQAWLQVVVDREGVCDLIRVTGSCAGDRGVAHISEIRACLGSVQVDDALDDR